MKRSTLITRAACLLCAGAAATSLHVWTAEAATSPAQEPTESVTQLAGYGQARLQQMAQQAQDDRAALQAIHDGLQAGLAWTRTVVWHGLEVRTATPTDRSMRPNTIGTDDSRRLDQAETNEGVS